MNTKNIFRMLLVAATLLLGANNVKATEETIWSKSASKTVEIDKSIFSNLKFTPNVIKIYADHVNSRFWAKDNDEILWRTSQYNEYVYVDGSDYDKAHYKTDHYEFEITSDIFSKLQAYGFKVVQDYGNGITSIVVSDEGSSPATEKQNASISFSGDVEMTFGSTFTAPTVTKTPSDAAITYSSSDSKIAMIDDNGNVIPVGAGTAIITGTFAGNDAYNGTSATYTLKVNAPTTSGANWQGAVWLDWNNQINTNIPTNYTFKSIKFCDRILIYGKRGPLHETNFNLELFQLNSNWSWGTKFVDLSQSNFSSENGCFTITVDNSNVEAIQNGLKDNVQGYCAAANGWNFTITAIKVIPDGSDTEPLATYSVIYSTNLTGGKMYVYKDGNYISSGTKVEAGSSIKITLDPESRYQTYSVSASYSGGYITLDYINSNNYGFTMPAGDVNIYASFERVAATPQVTIGSTGYATWTPSYAIDYSQAPNGIEAYRAESCSDGVVVLKQIIGQAAAYTPVLLKATNAGTYTFTEDVNGGYYVGTNLLKAGTGSTVGPSENFYILTLKNGVIVFAQAKSQGAEVAADKAYLDLTGASGARSRTVRLSFGDSGNGTTAINGIEDNAEIETVIYDLRGQRVDKPTKGLYIINGKKMMIK